MRQWFDLESQCMIIFWPKKVKFQQIFGMHLYSHVVHQNVGIKKANKFKPIFYKYFGVWDKYLTSKVSAWSMFDPKGQILMQGYCYHVAQRNVGIKKTNTFNLFKKNITIDDTEILTTKVSSRSICDPKVEFKCNGAIVMRLLEM